MGSNISHATTPDLAAHDRVLLTDFFNRCTTALVGQGGAGARILSILRDRMEATLREQRVPPVLSWTEHVTHPGTQPGPTVIHLPDSTAGEYTLHLDDHLREVPGLMLIEPPDPTRSPPRTPTVSRTALCSRTRQPPPSSTTSSTNPTNGSPARPTGCRLSPSRRPSTTS